MGLPGALLTTPGCSLDGVQGLPHDSTHRQQKPLQNSRASQGSDQNCLCGLIDCLGVVLSLLAVTQAQPHGSCVPAGVPHTSTST